MKKLRRLWWHLSDDLGLFLWTIVFLIASALLLFGADKALGVFR